MQAVSLTPPDLDRIAERFRALGDPTRLCILHALRGAELCVSEIVERMECSQANVSKHLGVLKNAGLVRARREGMHVYYSIDDEQVFEACLSMRGHDG